MTMMLEVKREAGEAENSATVATGSGAAGAIRLGVAAVADQSRANRDVEDIDIAELAEAVMPVMSVMSVMPSIYGVEFRIDQFSHFIPSQGCNEQHLDCLRTDFLSVREITSVFACSDDLVLEILKNVQANVALLRDDMASVKAGITSMRTEMAGMHTELAGLHVDIAGQSGRLDRIEKRLGLIEA